MAPTVVVEVEEESSIEVLEARSSLKILETRVSEEKMMGDHAEGAGDEPAHETMEKGT